MVRSYTGAPSSSQGFSPEPVEDEDGTRVPTPDETVLHVHRVLNPVAGRPPLQADGAIGQVARGWQATDGTRVSAVLITLRTA